MPTLAPKLPWTHAFAGGYPRVGGQPLPTDPDAIDYLNRVAAADGAAVEVGVAMAVDQFIKGCKADSAGYAGDPTRTVWDAMQASCIMCGARTISGALVPLRTPYGAELWSPASFIAVTDSGTAGSWDGESLTFSNASGSLTSYPRFLFDAGFQLNRRYRISGRLAGDIQTARLLKPRFSSEEVFVDATTGEFDGIALQSSSSPQLEIQFNSTAKSDFSVRIESLSIREDSFTPTPYNFVAADYDRSGGGLKGDGATKYLSVDTPSEYLQDDSHVSVFVSQPVTASGYVVSAAGLASRMYENFGSSVRIRMNDEVFNQVFVSPMPAEYLAGMSRQSSGSYDVRIGGVDYDGVIATSSTKPANYNFFGYPSQPFADCRLSFYSLGPALDLAALDARVSTLVTAIAAAI